jgi:hypothetical protein
MKRCLFAEEGGEPWMHPLSLSCFLVGIFIICFSGCHLLIVLIFLIVLLSSFSSPFNLLHSFFTFKLEMG